MYTGISYSSSQQLSVVTHQICAGCRHPCGMMVHINPVEPLMNSSEWAQRAFESAGPASHIRTQALKAGYRRIRTGG